MTATLLVSWQYKMEMRAIVYLIRSMSFIWKKSASLELSWLAITIEDTASKTGSIAPPGYPNICKIEIMFALTLI